MKLWVDVIQFLKKGASGGALSFFTYMELSQSQLVFHLFLTSHERLSSNMVIDVPRFQAR
jgi:hypothetical protein